MENVTFVQAIHKFFGRKEGQSVGEFSQEIKALPAKDRADLKAMFPSVGYTIID